MAGNSKRVETSGRRMLDPFDLLEPGAIGLPDDVKDDDLAYTHGVLEVVVPLPKKISNPPHGRPGNRAA